MLTEEYRAGAWICHGCSRNLQFSRVHGRVVQLCLTLAALLAFYLYGLRGLQLGGATILGGVILTIVLIGPLDRILPRKLELYQTRDPYEVTSRSLVTLFPAGIPDPDKPERAGHPKDEPPK